MNPEDVGYTAVLRGVFTDGDRVEWTLWARDCGAEGFTTAMRLSAAGRRAMLGSGGPKLRPGAEVSIFTGSDSKFACTVLAVRAATRVVRLVAETSTGPAEVTISEPFDEWGLRFGAAVMPARVEVVGLSLDFADGTHDRVPVRGLPSGRPPRGTAGWVADR